MAAPATKKVIIALTAQIDVMNSSRLKKFSFQIDKKIVDGNDKWTVTFDMFERKKTSDPFPTETPIHVAIDVTLATVVAKTETTALADNFTQKQVQFVLANVAAAAAQLKAGEITQDEFNAVVESTMTKR